MIMIYMKELLCFTNHHENANPNHDEIPFRMAIILKKSKDNKCWGRCVETGTFVLYSWKCKTV